MTIRAILTDIEGTTSSISFVKDVLFPYARKHLPAFIETHADKPYVQHWLHETAKEAGLVSASQQEIIDLLQRWIDEDRKATPLKALQGMIWEEGYRSGEYRAHVYPEVAQKLREWKAHNVALYVYSSGSVPAQKLFFAHTEAGDLSPLFTGYFDTEIGAKREVASYRSILGVIGRPGKSVLFLSDIVQELDAAHAAGMRTILLARPPSVCPAPGIHTCVADFRAIALD
jgi:enolase-phosphatase E1